MKEQEVQEKINQLLAEREFIKRNKGNYDSNEYYYMYRQNEKRLYYYRHIEYFTNYSSQWSKNNRDKVNAKSRKWRKNNPEKHKESTDNWRGRNPYNRKLWSITNWEKINGIDTVITLEDLLSIKEKFNHKCFNCGSKKWLVFDHFYPVQYKIPLSKENCVLLCNKCNSSDKKSKHPKEFFSKEQIKDLKENYGIKLRRKL